MNNSRDDQGRSYLAPAWSGDIADLTRDQLHHRIEALGAHIGRLFTGWDSRHGWQRTTPVDLDRWVALRIAALVEYDTRPAD